MDPTFASLGAQHGPLWWGAVAVLGLIVGVIAGMFGVGGGFLLTPMLASLFRVPIAVAVGTGLCQMVGVATSALLRYRRLGQGETKIAWMMMAGSLLGVALGAEAVRALDGMAELDIGGRSVPAARLLLSVGYALLLGFIALWMGRDARRPPRSAGEEAPAGPLCRLPWPPYTTLPRTGHRISVPAVAYLGLGLGFLSGLLGIGAGVIMVPLFVYGVGMGVRMAAGTGVLALLATSLVGTIAHARAGHVHLGLAMTLLVGSTLGAQVGATLTARISGQRLRGLFAYLVAGTGLLVCWDVARSLLGAGGAGR